MNQITRERLIKESIDTRINHVQKLISSFIIRGHDTKMILMYIEDLKNLIQLQSELN